MNNIEFQKIKNSQDLEVLKDKSAQYKDLKFSFSPNYIQKLADYLKSENAIQIIATLDDHFAGYIASAEILKQYPNYLVIFEIFVDPNMQGQGVGTELVQELIARAKNKNMQGLIVQTEKENIPAQNLYEKLGFIKIDNPNWKEGITYKYDTKY